MKARAQIAVAFSVCSLFAWAQPGAVRAHERSSSESVWRVESEGVVQVTLWLPARELSRLGEAIGADPQAAGRYVSSELSARTERGPCTLQPGSLRSLAARDGRRGWQWRLRCPAAERLSIETQLLARISPRHLHFARVLGAGERPTHHLLTEGRRSVELALSAAEPSVGFGAWLVLGVEHVLTGYDHLAFLLVLLVGATGLGALAWTLSGFTLGHALTLALASLGLLRAQIGLVEALIGLSIVVVAVENAWLRSEGARRSLPLALVVALSAGALLGAPEHRAALLAVALCVACGFGLRARGAPPIASRALLAGGFGLIHGLGFASALGEHGLPEGEVVSALVGFNLGVELGQLGAAALAWFALGLLWARRSALHARALDLVNGAACAAGVYWTLTRLL